MKIQLMKTDMTILMRENIIILSYLIPNIAQSMSNFCTLVTETNKLLAEIKLSG